MLSGDLTTANYETYFLDNMNHIRSCTTDPVAEGCWPDPGTYPTSHPAITNTAFVLHNGMTIQMGSPEDKGGGEVAGFMYLDWNGTEPPNNATDQMAICTAFGTETFINGVSNWGIIRPGQVKACENLPFSVSLYQEVFSN